MGALTSCGLPQRSRGPKWLSVKRKYVPADPYNALVQPYNVPVRAYDVLVGVGNVLV